VCTVPNLREIRADYDRTTVVVYQAYCPAVADAALAAGTFVEPFSFGRMTWIKPSFLWLMARSNWGRRPGQERTLAVRLRRDAWDHALSLAVPTDPAAAAYADYGSWRRAFGAAAVHAQWDTERSLRGAGLSHYSVQVGLSRAVVREYAEAWVVGLLDVSDRVRAIAELVRHGRVAEAKRRLPPERPYPVAEPTRRRLGMGP
jgi:hypothetical protein